MNDLPRPASHKASNWSVIWVLPIVALVIGGWLAWQAYNKTGVVIEVQFDSGDGIQPNKTEVMYKGISVGKVIALDVTSDIASVVAKIEMDRETHDYLSANTRFWLVKPRVSLAGVTGLETLVSGVYIAVDPVKGDQVKSYKALPEPPPMSESIPGLHMILKAERLGSIEVGSPIFFRQIQVGQVKSYHLADDQRTVEIKIHIEPAYANLVRKHTRFWNASGISVTGNLSGFKVRSESLFTLAAGGISFSTPENNSDSPPADTNKLFRLYEDYDAAQVGLRVKLKMTEVGDINPGHTPVMYNGVQVGLVKSINFSKNFSSAIGELAMDPRVEDLLVEGSEFWFVKPDISLAGVKGLDALIKGNYISVNFAKGGAKMREFTMRPAAPPLSSDTPGLHLVLTSGRKGSVEIGSPVLYRQVRVGSVQSYELSKDGRQVKIGVHVEAGFSHLVNKTTRFWNASGISLSGGINGLKVESESLQALIAGGISFDTQDLNAQALPKGDTTFVLHDNQESAVSGGLTIQLLASDVEGLREGSALRFRGLEVGKVERIELDRTLAGVTINVSLTETGQQLARAGTRFWIVRPAFGLLRTENLGTLVGGPYIAVAPGAHPGEIKVRFKMLPEEPDLVSRKDGLYLTLSAPRTGSLKVGSPVLYRQLPVGKVVDLKLGSSGDRVLIGVLVAPPYATLVRTGSRFWHASGVGVDAGLFKGLSLRTESLEALVAGGIAFATPDNDNMGEAAKQGQTFPLFDSPDEGWLKWAPKFDLKIGRDE